MGLDMQDTFAALETPCDIAAKTAMISATFASVMIPAAIPVTKIVYENQCNPATIMKVACVWFELADRAFDMKGDLDGELDGFNWDEDWSTSDGKSFKDHAGEYGVGILWMAIFAISVGVALMAIGAVLMAMVFTMCYFAVYLAGIAVQIIIALSSVLGAPAAAPYEAMGSTVAASALGTLKSLETATKVTGHGSAAAITGMLAVSSTVNDIWGSGGSWGNIFDGMASGIPDLIAGAASYFEREGIAKLIGGGSPLAALLGTGTNLAGGGLADHVSDWTGMQSGSRE